MNEVSLVEKNITNIFKKVCREFGENHSKAAGKSQKRELVVVRQVSMCMCMECMPGVSSSTIGKYIGGKDHATVLHARKTINDVRETNKYFNSLYLKVLDTIKNEYVRGGCAARVRRTKREVIRNHYKLETA